MEHSRCGGTACRRFPSTQIEKSPLFRLSCCRIGAAAKRSTSLGDKFRTPRLNEVTGFGDDLFQDVRYFAQTRRAVDQVTGCSRRESSGSSSVAARNAPSVGSDSVCRAIGTMLRRQSGERKGVTYLIDPGIQLDAAILACADHIASKD
jgi:hypothetical protein